MKRIQLKWGKEKFSLEVNTKDVAGVLKAQIFTLTLVPAERQKILGLKKKNFGDDELLDEAGIVEVIFPSLFLLSNPPFRSFSHIINVCVM
jgi:hypothetical protein